MKQRDITTEELEKLVDNDDSDFILWLSKEYCHHCKDYEKEIADLDLEGGILRIKLLFTQNRLLREIKQILGFDLRGFPVTMHIKGGDVIKEFYGNKIEKLRELIIEMNLTSM
ncbi:MAG: hypothetical protein Q8P68_02455 [Candidatus Peregrinibacteria bacterium]|nr:hypothetical protein [Candidatus Peregrinibacteria bacterium]MDZ4245104.1 hypothetical protein [Candidatus Gracilibacteria bacterium]